MFDISLPFKGFTLGLVSRFVLWETHILEPGDGLLLGFREEEKWPKHHIYRHESFKCRMVLNLTKVKIMFSYSTFNKDQRNRELHLTLQLQKVTHYYTKGSTGVISRYIFALVTCVLSFLSEPTLLQWDRTLKRESEFTSSYEIISGSRILISGDRVHVLIKSNKTR